MSLWALLISLSAPWFLTMPPKFWPCIPICYCVSPRLTVPTISDCTIPLCLSPLHLSMPPCPPISDHALRIRTMPYHLSLHFLPRLSISYHVSPISDCATCLSFSLPPISDCLPGSLKAPISDCDPVTKKTSKIYFLVFLFSYFHKITYVKMLWRWGTPFSILALGAKEASYGSVSPVRSVLQHIQLTFLYPYCQWKLSPIVHSSHCSILIASGNCPSAYTVYYPTSIPPVISILQHTKLTPQ